MLGWQISEPKVIKQINDKEQLDSVEQFKIKVKQVLLTKSDFDTFAGESVGDYPIIPGTIAVGEVVELGKEDNFYGVKPLTKVFFNPSLKTVKSGDDEEETVIVAGKNANGYLKDFHVTDIDGIYPLPQGITLNQATYIELISICISTIDTLSIEKGEHVAIIGGNILGNILAQVINYYQGVPMIIDSNQEKLELAKNCGVYYTLKTGSSLNKEIFDITGGRMVNKVVYISDSGLSTDIALKVARKGAQIGFIGFGNTNIKISCNLAMQKQVNVSFISEGFENTESSINLIINNALNLDMFDIKTVNFDGVKKIFDESLKKDDYDNTVLVKID